LPGAFDSGSVAMKVSGTPAGTPPNSQRAL
jgi:hypothetical protein